MDNINKQVNMRTLNAAKLKRTITTYQRSNKGHLLMSAIKI